MHLVLLLLPPCHTLPSHVAAHCFACLRQNVYCSPDAAVGLARTREYIVTPILKELVLQPPAPIDRTTTPTMRHPDYPIWSLICLILVLLPSPWHWRARNISTIGLIFWLAVYNFVVFINTLVWADNYADVAPVWNEISEYHISALLSDNAGCRITAVVPFAVPLSSLSQMRRLASVASPKRPLFSPKARRRRLIEEGIMCFFLPLLMLPLLYIVQGHRYDVLEGLGPLLADMNTWPSSVLRYLTTVLIALCSFVYAGKLLGTMPVNGFIDSVALTAKV